MVATLLRTATSVGPAGRWLADGWLDVASDPGWANPPLERRGLLALQRSSCTWLAPQVDPPVLGSSPHRVMSAERDVP